MRMFYLVFGLIPIFLASPLRAEEESDKPAEESSAVSEEVITSEVLEQSVVVDTTDPIVRLRMDAERKITVILEQIEELENVDGIPELQKEIERIKIEAEIKVLDIQLKKARERGDEKLVEEVETALDNLRGIYRPILEGTTEERREERGIKEKGKDGKEIPPPPPEYKEKEKKSSPAKVHRERKVKKETGEEETYEEETPESQEKGGAR